MNYNIKCTIKLTKISKLFKRAKPKYLNKLVSLKKNLKVLNYICSPNFKDIVSVNTKRANVFCRNSSHHMNCFPVFMVNTNASWCH